MLPVVCCWGSSEVYRKQVVMEGVYVDGGLEKYKYLGTQCNIYIL